MKIFRFALPLLAVVAIAVGAACTPVKQQFGKNVLAYTITNGCLPGLGDGQDVSNSFRSPSPTFSREVCSGGFAGHSPGPQGVTLQVVNSSAPDSGASFVTGGLNRLGDINAIKISKIPGGSPISVSLVMDKNGDGTFTCPPGQAGGLCGDAIASFQVATNGQGGEFVYLNNDVLFVLFAPCGVPGLGCLKPGPDGGLGQTSLANLKAGFHAGIDGFTPTVISVGLCTSVASGCGGQDLKSTVTGVEVNGQQFLP